MSIGNAVGHEVGDAVHVGGGGGAAAAVGSQKKEDDRRDAKTRRTKLVF